MYLDSAYIRKYYVNEPDSAAVRKVIEAADTLVSSEWAVAEVPSAVHRHFREGSLTARHASDLIGAFSEHVRIGIWNLHPVTSTRLKRVADLLRTAPASVFLRAGDAIHLVTALDAGEGEIWTNDRHLLAATVHFGLAGRIA